MINKQAELYNGPNAFLWVYKLKKRRTEKDTVAFSLLCLQQLLPW